MRFLACLPTLLLLPTTLARKYCKPIAGSKDWPSDATWTALSRSVSGNLKVPVPKGAVCHADWPQFNAEQCTALQNSWNITLLHAEDPVSVDYNDDTCRPNATLPCSVDGYPRYVIEARNAADVQAGVRFARETGVRLIIKGTGHDYPGRSSGPDSLAINTHQLRGLTFQSGDPAAVALGGVGSVKIFAGEQFRNVYAFASAHNITIIGGADPDVGIGGFISGGGHGPMTSKFGLAADQVIEMDVVTADGRLRTINATQEPDLFWALRGTFAVLVSVTVKAHPTVHGTRVKFSYNTTVNSDTFWSISTFFHTQLPRLSESGIMGYYYLVPQISANASSIIGQWLAPNLSPSQAKAILAPLEKNLSSDTWKDHVSIGSDPAPFSDFMSYWHNNNTAEFAGFDGRLGSRLVGNETLLEDFATLRDALRTSTPVAEGAEFIGHLVAGPGVRAPPGRIAGGGNAVLPAWRKAYSHIALRREWQPFDETDKLEITTELRNVGTAALRRIAPNTGGYMNEADPTEPNWQQTFYGANYGRLLEIKRKWDPAGVFWCKNCVGSELWSAEGSYGIENGVGQNSVRLCQQRDT